jgi:hypothetical protein
MNNLNDKPKEISKTTEKFSTDLATKSNQNEEFAAYEGVEYSFF